MKKLTLFTVFIFISSMMFAQEIEKVAKAKKDVLSEVNPDSVAKPWLIRGSGSIAFTQAAFSNWASGGQNSMGLTTYLNFKANYRKGKHVWANTVDLGYGFNIQGKSKEAIFNKTNDKIELTTAYGYELHKNKHWYLTVLANFRSQFANGFNYPNDSTVISKFLAPGYLVVGIGISYTPKNWFYLYISPASGRLTFVNDSALSAAGAFGVDPGKKMRTEMGAYLRADFNKDLAKNINLSSTLELFTNYLKNFGSVDVNWSLLLSMKVNKWLAASIQTQLIYDEDVMIQTDPTEPAGPRTQFKELFGIGLTYNLN
jgi:hypothetical protein